MKLLCHCGDIPDIIIIPETCVYAHKPNTHRRSHKPLATNTQMLDIVVQMLCHISMFKYLLCKCARL